MLVVRVNDDGAAKRAAAALREIERQIPKSIRELRREAFKAGAKQAKENLGSGGNLRGPIRKGVKVKNAGDESSLIANKVTSPNGISYDLPAAVNASNRYMVGNSRTSYSSGWRHPVYGNRSRWVTQQSPTPGWFTSAVEDIPIGLTEQWIDVLEEAAEYVAART